MGFFHVTLLLGALSLLPPALSLLPPTIRNIITVTAIRTHIVNIKHPIKAYVHASMAGIEKKDT